MTGTASQTCGCMDGMTRFFYDFGGTASVIESINIGERIKSKTQKQFKEFAFETKERKIKKKISISVNGCKKKKKYFQRKRVKAA